MGLVMEKNKLNIILVGDTKDEQISEQIISNLKSDYHIIHYNSTNTREYNKESQELICIYETEKIENIEKSILVIKNSAKNISNDKIPSENILIIDSENQHQIKTLCNGNLSVIVCGLSEKDTITFSSRETPTALVSLQREIDFCKNIIEPQEVQINSYCKNKYPILVAGVIVIIANNFPYQS